MNDTTNQVIIEFFNNRVVEPETVLISNTTFCWTYMQNYFSSVQVFGFLASICVGFIFLLKLAQYRGHNLQDIKQDITQVLKHDDEEDKNNNN